MRKSIISLLLVLALSLGGLLAAHLLLTAQQEQLAFRPVDLFGDPDAAEGIQITASTSCNNTLYWDSTVTHGVGTDTDFHFVRTGRQYPHPAQSFLYLYGSEFSASGGGLGPDTFFGIHAYWDLICGVRDRMEPGTTRRETLLLRDYMDVQPLEIDLSIAPADPEKDGTLRLDTDSLVHGHGYTGSTLLRELTEAFSFPVPENYAIDVELTTDKQGDLTSITVGGSWPEDGDPAFISSIDSYSAAADDRLFFVVEARNSVDDALQDYSGTRNGYGLYCLPTDPLPKDLARLDFLFPLDAQDEIVNLDACQAQHALFLVVRRGTDTTLRILDSRTGQETQRISLDTPAGEDQYIDMIAQDDLLLLFLGDDAAELYQQGKNGQYVHRLRSTLPCGDDPGQYGGVVSLAFDGTRLATVRYDRQYAAFLLNVCGKDGPLYTGLYRSNIAESPDPYGRICTLEDTPPIAVSFQ